ncbi:unnamed protein product [Effrenium voratum]|nr:unnamed protein product [Effrenium voratum]
MWEYQRLEPLINEPLKAGSAYFLVNRRWYMEWLQWVGAPSVQSPQMRPADPPLEGGFEMLSQGSVGSSRKKPRASSWTKDRPGQIDNSELLEEKAPQLPSSRHWMSTLTTGLCQRTRGTCCSVGTVEGLPSSVGPSCRLLAEFRWSSMVCL